MAGEIRIDGVDGFINSIDALIEAIEIATRTAVRDGASLIERNAKQGFAGQHPPGTPRPIPDDPRPYAVSEDLKRSIGRHPSQPYHVSQGVWQQSVAPTMRYARRIELGFTGQDSAMRTYNQPAYPYLGPAVKKALPELPRIFLARWNAVLERP